MTQPTDAVARSGTERHEGERIAGAAGETVGIVDVGPVEQVRPPV